MPLSLSLPRRLLLLVAIAALPAILFAAGALYWLNAERRNTLEETMIQTARRNIEMLGVALMQAGRCGERAQD